MECPQSCYSDGPRLVKKRRGSMFKLENRVRTCDILQRGALPTPNAA